MGSNKRWKRGWKDVGWGWGHMGESKNRKRFMSAWMEKQHPLPVTCWHISLVFDCTGRNSPFTHTHTQQKGKLIAEWMSAWGGSIGCICFSEIYAILPNFSVFSVWVECTLTTEKLNQLSTSTLLLFCWWWSRMPHYIAIQMPHNNWAQEKQNTN